MERNNTRNYVIACYNEPELQIPGNKDVIYKDYDIPNIGRESSSWLLWILNNYCNLPDYITFLQGDPFAHTDIKEITRGHSEHYERHGQLLECDLTGNPHHGGLNLRKALDIIGIPHPNPVRFCMGAQFTVSKERLLRYSYGTYAKLFEYSINDEQAPWVLERLWETMYN